MSRSELNFGLQFYSAWGRADLETLDHLVSDDHEHFDMVILMLVHGRFARSESQESSD